MPQQGQCNAGWLEFDDACWQFNLDKSLTLDNAEKECGKTTGGHVASIRNVYDASFITRYITQRYQNSSNQQDLWVGYKKQTNSYGQFHWLDGSCANHTDWFCGEPNNWASREDCTELRYGPKASGTGWWNDASCTSQYKFICSAPLPTGEELVASLPDLSSFLFTSGFCSLGFKNTQIIVCVHGYSQSQQAYLVHVFIAVFRSELPV